MIIHIALRWVAAACLVLTLQPVPWWLSLMQQSLWLPLASRSMQRQSVLLWMRLSLTGIDDSLYLNIAKAMPKPKYLQFKARSV